MSMSFSSAQSDSTQENYVLAVLGKEDGKFTFISCFLRKKLTNKQQIYQYHLTETLYELAHSLTTHIVSMALTSFVVLTETQNTRYLLKTEEIIIQ